MTAPLFRFAQHQQRRQLIFGLAQPVEHRGLDFALQALAAFEVGRTRRHPAAPGERLRQAVRLGLGGLARGAGRRRRIGRRLEAEIERRVFAQMALVERGADAARRILPGRQAGAGLAPPGQGPAQARFRREQRMDQAADGDEGDSPARPRGPLPRATRALDRRRFVIFLVIEIGFGLRLADRGGERENRDGGEDDREDEHHRRHGRRKYASG